MKAKKILTGALSLAMIVSLAACGGGSSATPTPGTEAPETTTPVTAAPEGDGSLQRVLDAGKLSIGAEGNWIPYVYNEDGTGELTGFEVEIAKEIASRLGVEAEFQISDSWDPVLAGLDAARYDIVICGVNPNPERQEKYAVTASYAENPYCLVVNGDNDEITSFEDLDGKLCINSPSSAAGKIAQSFGAPFSRKTRRRAAMENIQLLVDSFWPMFKAGLLISVPLMLVSFVVGLVLAFVLALMRMSKIAPFKAIAWFVVWVIRGTPLLVQIYVIYFGLPSVGLVLDPIPSAILALVISQGAYNSEVIRAALGSIPKGQFEACRALGLNKLQTMAQVVIPQAALVAVPSLGNSFISLLKDTSLVSSITVAEILMTAKSIIAVKFQPLLLYCEAALVYLIFSTVLTQLQGMLEKKLGKHLVDTRV